MPSPFVPIPEFPAVPPLPGVPPLLQPPGGFPFAAVALAVADALPFGVPLGVPQWGIFSDAGAPILVTDSVFSVEYARDYRISDYPQEQGAFQSYNKVQTPYQAKVTFLVSETRVPFLNLVEQAVASLQLVAVVTPDVVYPSANLTHYGYRRVASDGGVTLVRVEVWCEEVRITAGAALSASGAAPTTPGAASAGGSLAAAQSPSATPATNAGVVQTQPEPPLSFSVAPN